MPKQPESLRAPIVGITPDVYDRSGILTARCSLAYIDAVEQAGGSPVLLAPSTRVDLSFIDAIVLTGGDDPVTETYGVPTSEHAIRVLDRRQSFEAQILEQTHKNPDFPMLGVCLGMQMMALASGGSLNQHLPDTHTTHAMHWEEEHSVQSLNAEIIASGTVRSKHRQAVDNPGLYSVVASADDGVTEAIWDPDALFRLGVQWHPERTRDAALGQSLFDALVFAARGRTDQRT